LQAKQEDQRARKRGRAKGKGNIGT